MEGTFIRVETVVHVPIKAIGELLTCDDSEPYPLVIYGLPVRDTLAEKLRFTDEVYDELKQKAGDDYRRFAELVQQWAEEKIKGGELWLNKGLKRTMRG